MLLQASVPCTIAKTPVFLRQSVENAYGLTSNVLWLRGATVARLTPAHDGGNQKVACSNHVVISTRFFITLTLLSFQQYPGRWRARQSWTCIHSVLSIIGVALRSCEFNRRIFIRNAIRCLWTINETTILALGKYAVRLIYCALRLVKKWGNNTTSPSWMRLGSTGIWTRDLLHPKQESYA